MKFNTIIENISLEMNFSDSINQYLINNNDNVEIDCIQLSINAYSLLLNGKSHILTINKQIDGYDVTVDHHTYSVQVQDEVDVLMEKFGIQGNTSSHAGEIHALIPGLVSRLFVKPGDRVENGQGLLILEAMKMENEIDSPISGVVGKIYIKAGDKVEKGELIMEINN